jgi:uncharacterized protein YbjT (DUF2867 family)
VSIVVNTPTGQTGHAIARALLAQGRQVTVIARHPEKVEDLRQAGARVVAGSLEDPAVTAEALEGARALYWVTPPNMAAQDFRSWQRTLARNAATAVRARGVPYVVTLSSIGAQFERGNGPIGGLHDVERILEEAAPHALHLRPAFFMENYGMHAHTIREQGAIYMPVKGSGRTPMVATRDIAEVATRRLLALDWTGRTVQGIHGPADISWDEAAGILSEVLHKPVHHVTVTPDQTLQALLGFGISADVAGQYLEMYEGFDSGRITPSEPRTPETTTPTTFQAWARDAFAR